MFSILLFLGIGSSIWSELDDVQTYRLKCFEDFFYDLAANMNAWIITSGQKGIGRIVGTSREKGVHRHNKKGMLKINKIILFLYFFRKCFVQSHEKGPFNSVKH